MLDVKIDTKQFEDWARELSTGGLVRALRRGIDQSARAARKTALTTMAADTGVSPGKIKDAVAKVRATTQGSLTASFTVRKKAINIASVSGARVSRSSGLSASTFRLTGGGSASLNVKQAFMVRANGGRFIAIRRGKQRLPVKGVFAESPSTALGQDRAAAQVAWQKAANAELSQRLPREIQRQFYNERLSASSPADTGD